MENLSEAARAMGRSGGKKSVAVRLFGKSKKEISRIMSNVRNKKLKKKGQNNE